MCIIFHSFNSRKRHAKIFFCLKRVENIDNVTTSAFTEEKGQIIEEDYKNRLYHFFTSYSVLRYTYFEKLNCGFFFQSFHSGKTATKERLPVWST